MGSVKWRTEGSAEKMDNQKFKTLVSNDYDEITRTITEYVTPDLTKELRLRNRKLKSELTTSPGDVSTNFNSPDHS